MNWAQKSKSPSPAKSSKNINNNANFIKWRISFDKLSKELKKRNKPNNSSMKIQFKKSYHLKSDVFQMKQSKIDKNDISNLKGSPFNDNLNKNPIIEPPERDQSVLKSLDYVESPIIIEEDESLEAISHLK